MASNYYLGTSPEEALGDSPKYWYALRRNEDGELFLYRSDQLRDKDSIELNLPGDPAENFEDFEPGIDYFDGIRADHEVEYENLVWVQYRWDNRNMLYYIDQDEGRLIQRINQGYIYPTGISSNG
jgi:hypothetical protein